MSKKIKIVIFLAVCIVAIIIFIILHKSHKYDVGQCIYTNSLTTYYKIIGISNENYAVKYCDETFRKMMDQPSIKNCMDQNFRTFSIKLFDYASSNDILINCEEIK